MSEETKEATITLLHIEYTSFLLQLRDIKDWIPYPGHWGAFGGEIESHENPEIGLVKIDVEGSKDRVVDGMSQLLENGGELNVTLEYHPPLLERSQVDPREFLHRLTTSNFKVGCIDGDDHPILDDTCDLDSFVDGVWQNGVNLLYTRQ